MTHRPNAITHTREYRVLPGVVRYTFIISVFFTKPNLCPRHKILATPLIVKHIYSPLTVGEYSVQIDA